MSEIDKFAENLRRTIGKSQQAQLRFAICRSVDWNDKTMEAVGVSDDVPYMGVQLGFGYIDVKPAVDSVCLIGILEGKEALTFLINAETVELAEVNANKTVMNAGSFGGMVKIQELTNKLNALVDTFNAHTHQVATTGTAAAQTGTAAATATQAQIFNKTDYENEDITH